MSPRVPDVHLVANLLARRKLIGARTGETARLVVFDTSVVDLPEDLYDPVELLFSTRLGGGTDVNRALTYCPSLVTTPRHHIHPGQRPLRGGIEGECLKRTASMVASGRQFIRLPALSDEGAPCDNHNLAAQLSALNVPCFACTPDVFPDLTGDAISRRDINQWAAEAQIATTRKSET